MICTYMDQSLFGNLVFVLDRVKAGFWIEAGAAEQPTWPAPLDHAAAPQRELGGVRMRP